MSVIRSVLLLAGVVCSVLFAYFFGHALSVGQGRAYLAAVIALLVGVLLLAVYHRTGRAEGAAGSRP